MIISLYNLIKWFTFKTDLSTINDIEINNSFLSDKMRIYLYWMIRRKLRKHGCEI